MLEIGARVLSVRIQEQRIKPAVEIVMMCDVAPGAATRVELGKAAKQEVERVDQKGDCERRPARILGEDQLEELGDRAALHPHRAIHVGLAELQLGVGHDGEQRSLTLEGDFDRLAGSITDDE
jgi:hypothetical protein